MPRVKGSASGLFSTVCICAPATARAAPTTTAISATGRRMSQITTRSVAGTSEGETRADTTSPTP